MTSLINLNIQLLDDYTEWEKANQNNWNICSYLNQFYNVNAALAFSKFFFPIFIEKKGCVIFECRYDERIFNQWFEHFEGDIGLTEKFCNLYNVADYFHINPAESGKQEEQLKTLVSVLIQAWQINCSYSFQIGNLL